MGTRDVLATAMDFGQSTEGRLAVFMAGAETRLDRIIALYEADIQPTPQQQKRWEACNAFWCNHSHRQRRRRRATP